MKNFFKTIKRSVSDASFYKEIVDGTRSFSWRYASGLALIGAFLFSVFFGVTVYVSLVPSIVAGVPKFVPADLVLQIKSGELSVNQPVPYSIPLPREKGEGNVDNFLVIDTEAPVLLDAPKEYRTLAFANKSTLILRGDRGEVRAYPFSDFPDLTIDQKTVLDFVSLAAKFAWILPVFAFVFFVPFKLIGIAIISLFAGFLLWVALKIGSHQLTFKKSFVAAFYAHTIVFLLSQIMSLFDSLSIGFFLSTILTFAVALFFVKKSQKTAAQS